MEVFDAVHLKETEALLCWRQDIEGNIPLCLPCSSALSMPSITNWLWEKPAGLGKHLVCLSLRICLQETQVRLFYPLPWASTGCELESENQLTILTWSWEWSKLPYQQDCWILLAQGGSACWHPSTQGGTDVEALAVAEATGLCVNSELRWRAALPRFPIISLLASLVDMLLYSP